MAGPSSSFLDDLQKQLIELNGLVIDELRKGANRNEDLLTDLRQEKKSLDAQIERHASGEVEHHGSVLCCQASLAPGLCCFISMHTHVIVA